MHPRQAFPYTPMSRRQRLRPMAGVTLVELLITLVIGAIMMALAVPGFQDMITNSRIATHTNDFIGSLNLARVEAIKRGRRVVLCKSSDGASCAASGGWGQGWIVFVDMNNNAAVNTGDGDVVLRARGSLAGGDTLQGSTDLVNYISYSADGFARLTTGAFQSGTLTFSLCGSDEHINVIMINLGHVHTEKQACP